VIVVTGTPGVGKSQFSHLLAKKTGAIHVDIGKVTLDEGFTLGMDPIRLTKIADLEKISSWIGKSIRESRKDVIVDGHYASAIVPKELVRLAIVLRCEPSELLRRLRKKQFPKRKALENVAAEILDSCLIDTIQSFGRRKVCEIDTTDKTLNLIVAEALTLLRKKSCRRIGKVNWLDRLKATGQLDKLMVFMSSTNTRSKRHCTS
jgi:adenylate kinase